MDSKLGGHPDRNKLKWVEASTGSLGHGFPIAAGIAFGEKIKGTKSKVYVIIGDGECNEGTIWETAMLASHHKLDNLCCVVDNNHSSDRALDVGDLEKKFAAFGWKTSVVDGHNHLQLEKVLKTHAKSKGKPFVIIAKTIKGHGVKIMENNPAWHHLSPKEEELEKIRNEIY